jgi:nucleoside-diphosphate-sugar epimerase
MRILITGISGFIGQYLAEGLTADGHEVHGLYEHAESKAKNALPEDNQHVVNLTDHEGIAMLIAYVQPEVVLHLASRSEVALSFRNYTEVTNVNYVAVVNLAEACRQHSPDLKAFVMASTMETYGNAYPFTGTRAFTEETLQFPMAPYAVAKLACEKYLAYMGYAYDFPHIVLRQTNTYGRRDNAFFIVERIVSQMLSGDTCNLGVEWPVRNFLWIHDLVDFYRVVLDQLPLGETFVTGPDNAVTIGALTKTIQRKLNWDGQVNWGTVPERAAEVPYLNSDPAKAKRLLGWEPTVGLSEGLDRTIEMWRAIPEAAAVPSWASTHE